MKGDTAASLLVSNDKGATWSQLVSSPPWGSSVIVRLYVDRGNPNLMFAGTATNAYMSTNAGVTWSVCPSVSGTVVGFLVDQASSVSNRTCFAATSTGVWRSDNHGAAWTSKITGLPASPSLVSFSGGSTASKIVIYCVEASSDDIYKSINKGDNWTSAMGTGIDASQPYSQVIAADAFPDTIYVNHEFVSYTDKIYKSTDNGTNWQSVYSPSTSGGNVELGWGDYEIHVNPLSRGFTINPADANQVLGSYTFNYMTTNGGTSWKQMYTKYADTGVPAAGKKWSSRGIEVTSTWNYNIDPSDANKHYICYTDIGFARSDDAGVSWTLSRTGSPWLNTFYQIAFDPDTPGVIYGAASNDHDLPFYPYTDSDLPGGAVKSTDYGKTWTSISTGLPTGSSPCTPATSIVIDPSDKALYITMFGDGVYKSIDKGNTWTKKSTGLAIGANKHVYSVRVHNDGTLFCNIAVRRIGGLLPDPGGLFKSTNKGETWTNISASCPLYWQMEYDVHPADSNIIYMGAYGHGEGGIYKTSNGGTSWSKLTLPVSDPLGFSPCIDPMTPSTVYFTGHSGTFVSYDSGSTWAELTGIPYGNTTRVTFDSFKNAMYFTTFGGGIWKQGNSGTVLPPTTGATINAKGYPNPCRIAKAVNKQFKIIDLPADAVIEIYNSSGELVRKLLESDFGNFGWVGWDGKNSEGSDVPAGMYIYSIVTSIGIKTGKVGILR
ncbi:MAG: hypothetical protein A2231_12710 [Candidatus Firestonebacteria bacterium RIFOXYA2_FULL_40_8]|nr:MAG: hypothetical protein A2231_12710 [Candidatus Firestonebacteria bacterium RIFOXYA2_FULL_40_8]